MLDFTATLAGAVMSFLWTIPLGFAGALAAAY
jgi:hypothetical protein